MTLCMCGYQTKGAVFSSEQVCEETTKRRLVSPAPASSVQIGGNGQVDVGHKASQKTCPQRHQTIEGQPLWGLNMSLVIEKPFSYQMFQFI